MKRCRLCIGVLTALSGCAAAYGWGPTGHQIVALIAEHRLNPKAAAEVRRILGDGVSMPSIGVWADEIKKDRPETGPWHYVDIPPDAQGYDAKRDCPDGNGVVAKVEQFARELGDPSLSPERRNESLRFLVHFVGDLHMPLHTYGVARGGNDIKLTCFGHLRNLHEIWDITLFELGHITSAERAAELIADIDEADVPGWVRGSPADWATESWMVAATSVALSPRGRPLANGDTIGRAYVDGALVVVDQQLTRAGVRLASMLNRILGDEAPSSQPASSPASHPASAPANEPEVPTPAESPVP